MSEKTNAVRILENNHIEYEMLNFEVDESDLSAEHIAEIQGIEPERIFKTLVLVNNEKQHVVAVIPSNWHLDLKKIAKASDSKKCEMIPMKDLLSVTGYIRGGCSPVGMKKHFPTYIEESAQLFEKIFVSAGKRGHLMGLKPEDLLKVTEAVYADLVEN